MSTPIPGHQFGTSNCHHTFMRVRRAQLCHWEPAIFYQMQLQMAYIAVPKL